MLILIADDDTHWTDLAAEWAKTAAEPHEVRTRVFSDPAELVKALENDKKGDLSGRAVVFLDLDFSGIGASGFDALFHLKSHRDADVRNLPIVIYSRSDSPEEIEKCYSARANSYVHKGKVGTQQQIFRETVKFWVNAAKLPEGLHG